MKPGIRVSAESPGAIFRLVNPLTVSVETKIKIWRSKIPFMIVVIEMAMKVQRNKRQMKQ